MKAGPFNQNDRAVTKLLLQIYYLLFTDLDRKTMRFTLAMGVISLDAGQKGPLSYFISCPRVKKKTTKVLYKCH
jgi:hypothetical protein